MDSSQSSTKSPTPAKSAKSLNPPRPLNLLHPHHPIVEVRNLSVSFSSENKTLHAVRDVSFSLYQGKTLCLVGESGCGKSMTALALMGLLPEQGSLTGDILTFEGHDLLSMAKNSKELRALRGRHMAMIFQDPMTSLNPVYRVGEQVAEALRLHLGMSKAEARARTIELFRQVGIPSPELRIDDYPHQLSGGMRQRVMIAMALSCGPRLLIADEPTTALDVTVQKQILQLLASLRSTCHTENTKEIDSHSQNDGQHHGLNQTGAAILFITHDLGVVAQTADEVAVMYAGRIVEHASVHNLFAAPMHPYTQGLMASAPTLDITPNVTPNITPVATPDISQGGAQQAQPQRPRLTAIKGNVPPLDALPSGCTFHDRCPKAMERCALEEPPCVKLASPTMDGIDNLHQNHSVRCWLYADA
ncbi:MAG: ABC transporter ATP-binding protein [Pseudomonadota bacterium]